MALNKYYKDHPITKAEYNAKRHTFTKPDGTSYRGLQKNAPPTSVKFNPAKYVPGGAPTQSMVKQTIRPGQAKFRRAILARDGCCVVTGTRADCYISSKGKRQSIVHAAHIKPISLCSDEQYWDLDNGLTMRADVHVQFDHGLFTISPTGLIRVRPKSGLVLPRRISGKLTKGQRAYLRGHTLWTKENWASSPL